jgi:hypothetical protein
VDTLGLAQVLPQVHLSLSAEARVVEAVRLALEAAPVLPQRWEVRKTDEGQTYGWTHKARTTSWVRLDMIDNMDPISAGWEARSVRDG